MQNNEESRDSPVLWCLKKIKPGFRALLFGSMTFLLLAGNLQCNRIEELFDKKTPRANYLEALEDTPISGTKVWREWMSEGDSVLAHPVLIEKPFRQKLVYFVDEPNAWAWQLEVPSGRRLKITCVPADTSHRLFTDLFVVREKVTWEKSARDSVIEYESDHPQTLIVRVQAEILINGTAQFTIRDYPTLGFPVLNAKPSDIGSFWGDSRDAGVRKHEGVDIFASRGTPAIAAADGRVIRTGDGGLGGKTVWLRSSGLSLYYAHLDSIDVNFGKSVRAGDTIGFVGNTGNARTTSPHLHFGIYRQTAIDPFPYIDFPNIKIDLVQADIVRENKWGRITGTRANIRPLPSTLEDPLATLSRDQIIRIRGGVKDWYQVELPDGRRGFVHHRLVSTAMEPVFEKKVKKDQSLFFEFEDDKSFFNADTTIFPVYGNFAQRILTRYMDHWFWMEEEE